MSDAPFRTAVAMDGACAPTVSDSGRRGLNSSQGRVSSGEAGGWTCGDCSAAKLVKEAAGSGAGVDR